MVDAPEVLDHAGDTLRHLFVVGDVDLPESRCRGVASDSPVSTGRVDVEHRDACAETPKHLDHGGTDDGCAAGDDGDLALETLHG